MADDSNIIAALLGGIAALFSTAIGIAKGLLSWNERVSDRLHQSAERAAQQEKDCGDEKIKLLLGEQAKIAEMQSRFDAAQEKWASDLLALYKEQNETLTLVHKTLEAALEKLRRKGKDDQ